MILKYTIPILITGYQRFISPYKGFRCAYGVQNSGCSCSQIIKSKVKQNGFSIEIFSTQFRKCREANLTLMSIHKSRRINRHQSKSRFNYFGCTPSFSHDTCDFSDCSFNPFD